MVDGSVKEIGSSLGITHFNSPLDDIADTIRGIRKRMFPASEPGIPKTTKYWLHDLEPVHGNKP